MNGFILILLCLGIGVVSRFCFCFTHAIGKRTTGLGRFFLDFAWAGIAPLLLFLVVFFFNRGVFVIHFPLFVAGGFVITHIIIASGKPKTTNNNAQSTSTDKNKSVSTNSQ